MRNISINRGDPTPSSFRKGCPFGESAQRKFFNSAPELVCQGRWLTVSTHLNINLGLANEMQRQYKEAVDCFKCYLIASPDAPDKDTVKDICPKHGITDATYYNLKSKYGGIQTSDLKRMKEMERELTQLTRLHLLRS